MKKVYKMKAVSFDLGGDIVLKVMLGIHTLRTVVRFCRYLALCYFFYLFFYSINHQLKKVVRTATVPSLRTRKQYKKLRLPKE